MVILNAVCIMEWIQWNKIKQDQLKDDKIEKEHEMVD